MLTSSLGPAAGSNMDDVNAGLTLEADIIKESPQQVEMRMVWILV